MLITHSLLFWLLELLFRNHRIGRSARILGYTPASRNGVILAVHWFESSWHNPQKYIQPNLKDILGSVPSTLKTLFLLAFANCHSLSTQAVWPCGPAWDTLPQNTSDGLAIALPPQAAKPHEKRTLGARGFVTRAFATQDSTTVQSFEVEVCEPH